MRTYQSNERHFKNIPKKNQRIYKKCENNISNSQFGFRKRLSIREAILVTKALVQTYNQRKDFRLRFIDHEILLFVRVNTKKLEKLLDRLDID